MGRWVLLQWRLDRELNQWEGNSCYNNFVIRVCTFGQMKEGIWEIGKQTTCTGKVSIHGKMEGSMKGII
jgi:hypothetical protein